jgi:hypothetical protein
MLNNTSKLLVVGIIMAHYTGIYNEFCYLKIIEHYMLQDSCHHEKAVRIYIACIYLNTPPPSTKDAWHRP